MELHPIQKHVFRKLSEESSLAYVKLKPARVEGNQFTYHLKKLAARGYLQKKNGRYQLTTKGIQYTTTVSFEYFSERIQPKIVTLLVCKDKAGKYLVYSRGKQPFLGMIGFPYGKIHLGEKIEEAATRELQEKCGMRAKLSQKGIAYLLVRDAEGEILTHMICHVFSGVPSATETSEKSTIGKLIWMKEDEIEEANCMPGVDKVLAIAKRKSGSLAFEEFEFEAAQ